MINGLIYQRSFIENPNEIFSKLLNTVEWDEQMKSRKAMSYGKAYNYSQIEYLDNVMIPELQVICIMIERLVGYQPNNCLLNLYSNGRSKMGYHSDQIDILEEKTGITIISIGEERKIKFRNINKPEIVEEFLLENGSFFHMNQEVQKEWQHSIPKDKTTKERLSLTFRKLK